jgi:hypothetical protein
MGPNLQTSLLVSKSLLLSHMQTSIKPESMRASRPPPNAGFLDTCVTLNLPPGLLTLIHTGYLSHASVEILLSFSSWLSTHRSTDPSLTPVWRYSSSGPLCAVEKCLFTALLCLADDLSGMGLHPAAMIFRQPRKRAEMLLAVHELWTHRALADCLVWLVMVITTPRNPGITPFSGQRELFSRIVLSRPDLTCWADVEGVLRCFFYEESRAPSWKATWNAIYNQTARSG